MEFEKIEIESEYIKLDQLLKFANLVESGADAKLFIQNGYVKVDGETETRRGRKLRGGEKVEIEYEDQHFGVRVEKCL